MDRFMTTIYTLKNLIEVVKITKITSFGTLEYHMDPNSNYEALLNWKFVSTNAPCKHGSSLM